MSTSHTKEEAIAGVTSGLVGLHESVTWRATHFGVSQTLSTKITEYERPSFFVDEMVHGVFKSFRHEHRFEQTETGTLMTDVFEYQSPFGLLGKLADFIFLKRYMTTFLVKRNETIKAVAESDQWKSVPGL
ncbi:MAG: SRPBCC family protein [Imperialibacter sp.]